MKPRLSKEDKAGLWITISAHLIVVIILLACSLGRELSKENSFVLDFTKAEQIEKLQKEIEFKKDISRKLEQMIADAENGSPIRNVTVDKGGLKDDRGTDAQKLYEEAERLQRKLDGGFKAGSDDFYTERSGDAKRPKQTESSSTYSGPSVLAWELAGRKASKLPIPAYRCLGAGEVKVIIAVAPNGTVVSASIDNSCSSSDGCLRDFAVRAARLSKFSVKTDAPARQAGSITYQFIAQ